MVLETLLKGGATVKSRTIEEANDREFWADAMVSDTRVGIGGWEKIEGREAKDSPWYAEETTEEEAPWLFKEGSREGPSVQEDRST